MPASLDWVRSRLRERGLREPNNVTFVPIDLEQYDIRERLVASGFVSNAPMFCSALGIVQYLSAPAVNAMLGFAASCVQDSEMVFSFSVSSDKNTDSGRQVQSEAMQRTDSYGEPWLTLMDPSVVVAKLDRLGFRESFLLTPELAAQRYFCERDDGLRISGSELCASAIR
jgi:O-methyltransferase involved in polyketide biosynthesis